MSLLAAFVLLACAAGSTPSTTPTTSAREEVGVCSGGPHDIGMSVFLPEKGRVSLATAIVVVGAQRWDRYGNLVDKPWGHYRDIAEALASRGAAAVLFDKGGTGKTGGPPPEFDDRVREVLQVAACVKQRPDVGPVTLVGHSQGAAVVVTAAAAVQPAALVLLSPAAGVGEPPAGIPVTILQAASEATPALHPIVIPNVNHLLLPQPATPGVTHMAPEALQAITDAVLATHR